MKRSIIFLTILAIAFTVVASIRCTTIKANNSNAFKKKTGSGIEENTIETKKLVELFTSEGCSSCPPAEKIVAAASKQFASDAIILCYHVDYWNYLGWKDEFSKKIFTNRQKQYANQFNLESIYTPQLVVNGSEQFVGSNKSKLIAALSKPNNNNGYEIKVATESIADKTITLNYVCNNLLPGENIVIALVQKMAKTKVLAGENSGETLPHINIVKDIKQEDNKQGKLTLTNDFAINKNNFFVVAFIQNTQTLAITSTVNITLQ